MTEKFCPCVKNHVPNPKVTQRHHIVPKSWGGTDSSPQVVPRTYPGLVDANLLPLCPTSHENTHRLLNDYIRHGLQTPPWSVRQHYTRTERELAAAAWDWWVEQNGLTKPPYTVSVDGDDTLVVDRPAKLES